MDFAIQCFVSFLVLQISPEKDGAACFTLIVFLKSCGCKCSVPLSLNGVGLSVLCNCGIT